MRALIVIAAHDEAAVIGSTVAACRRAYSAATVLVIADRCSDDTAAQAGRAGALVVERAGGPWGKGAALAWLVQARPEALAGAEAVVVYDADSEPRPGTTGLLVAALESADAAQGFVYPAPDLGSHVSVLAAYSEWLSQALDDRLRAGLRWPVPLRGTGMAMKASVFGLLAPRLRTKVEDVELTLLMAAGRGRIAFVPEAVVVDPKPTRPEQAVQQRARWLQGQRAVWRYYWRPILRLLVTGGPAAWSLLSALLMKPRTLIMAGKALLVLLLSASDHPVVTALRLLIAISLAIDLLRYLIGVWWVPRGWRGAVVRALALAPFYAALWLRAGILSLLSRGVWHRARD